MISLITQGIKVSVETAFQDKYDLDLTQDEYFFSYRITINNASVDTVQLLRRHWFIFDSRCQYREVEGEGVVGAQPVLLPSESFEYTSGCALQSTIGKMHGYYVFKSLVSNKLFKVDIPAFSLVFPPLNN